MNNTKSILLIIGIVIISLFSCLTKENHKAELTESEMFKIMKNYITVKDTALSVEITRDSAYKLGVSLAFYDTLMANVIRGNKMVKNASSNDDYIGSLNDYKNDSIIRFKKGNQAVSDKNPQ